MSDIDLMNGMITASTLVHETPHQKEYRIIAVLTAEPDLSRYPFDKHTLPVKLEPRENHEDRMVVVNDASENGINPDADIPGWRITGSGCSVTNMTYLPGEVPFSRIVHEYWIERDAMSTSLRFFIPLILIVIVSLSLSLSSLLMKISSRLAVNASMFLAAVLYHWRISDTIPVVGYATFLDLFMLITYATLVMVLVSGILMLSCTDEKSGTGCKDSHLVTS